MTFRQIICVVVTTQPGWCIPVGGCCWAGCAEVMLGARFNIEFIVLGCAVMAVIALAAERRIPDHANGITAPQTPATELLLA
jgi:hypothetical protein